VSFAVRGFTPVEGQRVDVLYKTPNVYEFTGTIVSVTGDAANAAQDPLWTIQAVDDRWLMDRFALVTGYFASRNINGVLADILASSTNGGFVVGHVPGGAFSGLLGPAGLSFSGARISETIQTLRGAAQYLHWWVTPERHVSINSSFPRGFSAGSDWVSTTGVYPWFRVSYSRDISQSRTRVTVEGRATTVVTFAAIGATTVYVADASAFSPSGGTARVGAQDLTYTSTGTATVSGNIVGTLTGVSGVVQDIPVQALIRPITTSNDTSAQTALAAILGLSGIAVGIERHPDADQDSTASLAARALAISADAVPIETLTFSTQQPLGLVNGRINIIATAPFGSINLVLTITEITLTHTRDATGDDFVRHVTAATKVADFDEQLSRVMATAGRAS
jgi:hypothetical protein